MRDLDSRLPSSSSPYMEHVIYPNLPEPLRSAAIDTHRAFHDLWSKAVGTPDYDKSEWRRLGNAIDTLVTASKGK